MIKYVLLKIIHTKSDSQIASDSVGVYCVKSLKKIFSENKTLESPLGGSYEIVYISKHFEKKN